MAKSRKIGLLWAQFSAYHIDRIEAAAIGLSGDFVVQAVQVSKKSHVYAWEPNESAAGAHLVTLFDDKIYEEIPWMQRLWRQYKALKDCKTVFIGIAFSEPDIIPLAWMLRLSGVQVIMMSASKYEDFDRFVWKELFKTMLLSVFQGAVVGGRRQAAYLRFLGFRRRKVYPGYNTVSMERVRQQARRINGDQSRRFEDRPFIYVGRFVPKKNLLPLIDAYALYAKRAGPAARRLELIGSGALEGEIKARIKCHGIEHLVDFPGFLSADAVAARMEQGLALLILSIEEQWGLVVNEALAVGLPILSSVPIGANDVLIRNLLNGYIVETNSIEGMAKAMAEMARNEAQWREFSDESHRRAELADTARFADAVRLTVMPEDERAAKRVADFMDHLGMPSQRL